MDPERLTENDLAGLRFVILTQRRIELLEKYKRMVLGDQAGSSILMFRTSFSYRIIPMIEGMADFNVYVCSPSWHFDNLLAFMLMVTDYDHWARDNEDPQLANEAIDGLVKVGKRLLAKSNASSALTGSSRPGFMTLINIFEALKTDCCDY